MFGNILNTPLVGICPSVASHAVSKTTPNLHRCISQPVITCSKLTIETLEQSVKYVQS